MVRCSAAVDGARDAEQLIQPRRCRRDARRM